MDEEDKFLKCNGSLLDNKVEQFEDSQSWGFGLGGPSTAVSDAIEDDDDHLFANNADEKFSDKKFFGDCMSCMLLSEGQFSSDVTASDIAETWQLESGLDP